MFIGLGVCASNPTPCSNDVFFIPVTSAGLKSGASRRQRPKGRMVLDEIKIGRRDYELEVDLLRIPHRDREFYGRGGRKKRVLIR
jgi:hypothetical protein